MSDHSDRIWLAKQADPFFELHPFDDELISDGQGGWKPLPELPPRPESLRDRLATIIQRGYVEKRTADEVAGEVLEAMIHTPCPPTSS